MQTIPDRINGMRPTWRHILVRYLNYSDEGKKQAWGGENDRLSTME